MTLYTWSKTAAADATADATINWAEGQAPSSVNDSARAMMAAIAKYRDDNGPNLQTGGTATAYTLTSNQVFASAALMAGQEIAFFVHVSNSANPTLTVDGIGPFPIVVDALAAPIPFGAMQAGSVQTVVFSNTASQFRLKGYYLLPFNVPVGGSMLYWGTTVPNGHFAFLNGAAISRSVYSVLFGIIGTTYGVGDGSTTFNLPDLSGRVPAGRESSASRLTATYFGGDSTALGATGGLESHTLTTAQLAVTVPAGTISQITPAGTVSQITPAGSVSGSSSGSDTILVNGNAAQNLQGGTTGFGWSNSPTVKAIASALGWSGSFSGTPVTPTFSGTPTTPTFSGSSFGSGSPHKNVQPTIICNYIMRII